MRLKQFDIVIQQFIKKFSENKNIRLVVIGSGSERKKLENLTVGNDQIRFAGELELKDVAIELNKADVLVSFSKYETFCVPVAEAWLCGKPTIVSDKEGVASYLNHNLGISVPYDKPSELGNAIDVYKRQGLECPRMIHVPEEDVFKYNRTFENDIWYVENVSFLLDVKMFFALVKMVFSFGKRGNQAQGKGITYFIGYNEKGQAMSLINYRDLAADGDVYKRQHCRSAI